VRQIWFAALVMVAAAGTSMQAHHSFAAHYFESESVTIDGHVQEFQYRNPHAWLLVSVRMPEGHMQTYSAEWANPRRLGSQGVTERSLQPGERVIVTGSPGRVPEEYKIHLKGLRRPADGWTWGNGRRR
jgi:hypothetical protein